MLSGFCGLLIKADHEEQGMHLLSGLLGNLGFFRKIMALSHLWLSVFVAATNTPKPRFS